MSVAPSMTWWLVSTYPGAITKPVPLEMLTTTCAGSSNIDWIPCSPWAPPIDRPDGPKTR